MAKNVNGWVAIIHDPHTNKHYASGIIYATKEQAMAAPKAVAAFEFEVEYEIQ